ncbi:MAG: type 3 dihydrofolate reductase [Halieaceae bacterium]
MKLALIVAVAENGVVGRDNSMPWHLPEDLKYFKRTTLGKPVLMGRKTWESIGRPLPGRSNIVITRQAQYQAEGAQVVADLQSALALAESVAAADGSEELMVIGGAEIYRAALPLAQRLYITEVHAEVTGDVFFPDWDRRQWRELARERHSAASEGDFDYSFVVYERI